MAKTDDSKKKKSESTPKGGDIHVGGSVSGNNIIIGHNNTIIIDGKPVTFRTGWFFGHRYGDLETFTGRADELKLLDEWLANKTESLLIFNAFGGFGKSALTWHWLNNHVDTTIWSTAIWWSFYEKESGFDSFLAETLTHLGIETKERSSRQQVNDLLDVMQKTGLLIVLDGFERLLRQYGRMDAALQEDDEDAEIDPSQRDCTYQSAETFLRGLSDKKIISKVLMTSRLFPRALEGRDGKFQKGCREVNLKGFSSDDAVTYFHNEGIKATRAEIIEVCSAYGYHPLSLSLLIGWINREEGNEHRGDIVEAKNLDIFDNIKASRDHVLKRAYESLAPERRDLLSKISCFRGSMGYAVLKKVFPSPDLDKALLDLRKRGLLQYAGETGRYDMHPIVRHYAYERLNEIDKINIHVHLANYFEVVPAPQKVSTLEDLSSVIELYHHTVRAGNFDTAKQLFRDKIDSPTYFQFGAYQLQVELLRSLFLDGEDALPNLKNENDQAETLSDLAANYAMMGLPSHALSLYEMQITIRKKLGDMQNLSIGFGAIASVVLLPIGRLREAERNLRHKLEISNKLNDEWQIGNACRELSKVLMYTGEFAESRSLLRQSLVSARKSARKVSQIQDQGAVFAYRALYSLLATRDVNYRVSLNGHQLVVNNPKSATCFAKHALRFADEDAKTISPALRDYVRAYWLLGSAYRANNELTLAEENLFKALNLCQQINLVEMEANILLDLARLRYAQGDFKDAQEKASEALMITERSGYVLQGADVNLFLAQYALEQEKDKAKAKVYAEEAKKLATCDGPPYYYKVAYEEAEAMLKKLK